MAWTWQARLGVVWQLGAWRGLVWYGVAGKVRQGMAGRVSEGQAGRGEVWSGKARLGWAVEAGLAVVRYGVARCDRARRGRLGKHWFVRAGRGTARYGEAGRGSCGVVRQGLARWGLAR